MAKAVKSLSALNLDLVDYISEPIDFAPIKLLEYQIPRRFKSFLLLSDENSKPRNWSVEFLFEIGVLGTPKVIQVTPRGLTDQEEIVLDGKADYIFEEDHDSVTPRQLEMLQKHFRRLVIASLQIAIQTHTYQGDGSKHKWTVMKKNRNISRENLIAFSKEMANITAKTRLTDEFLKKIEEEHSDLKKNWKVGRFSGNDYLATKYLVDVKTIESWLSKAKKVSAKKAGSKPKTKAKKGE